MTLSTSAVAVCCWRDLGQVLGALLYLVKQAHVFDRDHSLIGEGPQQRDLPFGERVGLGSNGSDGADGLSIAEHGDR